MTPLIVAIEPDRRQASQVTAIARRLRVDLVIGETTERTLAELGTRVPDLILASALLSPKDEAALADRLRELDACASHVQMLTIPVFATRRKGADAVDGVLDRLRGKKKAATPDGCDPGVFAEQIADYLKRAASEREARAERAAFGPPEPVFADRTAIESILPEPAAIEPAALDTFTEFSFDAPANDVDSFVDTFNEANAAGAVDASPVDETGDVNYPVPAHRSYETSYETPVTFEEASVPYEPAAAELHSHRTEPVAEEQFAHDPVVEEHNEPVAAASAALEALIAPFQRLLADHTWTTPTSILSPRESASVEFTPTMNEPVLEEFASADAEVDAAMDTPSSELSAVELESTPLDQNEAAAPAVVTAETSQPALQDFESFETDIELVVPQDTRVQPRQEQPVRWMEALEALRLEVEQMGSPSVAPRPRPDEPRNDAADEAAAASSPQAQLRKTRRRKEDEPDSSAVQDEWGFFDPEQCGFAALLAKLDEITEKKKDDKVKRPA